MASFHLAVGSTADVDLHVEGVNIGECLRQPNNNLLDAGPNVSPSSFAFRIKDHNTEVQAVFNLHLKDNAGDTAYASIKAGSHSAGWHATAIVSIFKDGVRIASTKINSGLNIGAGDSWGNGQLSFSLS